MEPLDKRKKNEELFQLKNIIANICKEFGDDIEIIDGEKPDFSIVLPDKTVVGMEVTKCCPSERKREMVGLKMSYGKIESRMLSVVAIIS